LIKNVLLRFVAIKIFVITASGSQGALFEKTAREASGPLQKLFIKRIKKKYTMTYAFFNP